ncbi:hypothetical protein I302_104350 [Kwoniella bestiolae CBS 10118]|uniref:CCR4-NOT transcription complex subunit 2 n=1 Tax=Kwoniella bestiolae CBS 10118 TaxID=1296100 RepID=A0A1B9GB05_9TREE|nr:CCR4-NOT transcription complex subunit 2 [Kwoniella bestiolae CBS 10118]OCF28206.1 CCR4-NOT transcription complex subunit 2 [Kwoniella bestiolae CBS 10118]
MYYATAGQQATQQPPSSRGAISGYPRGGPPGFSARSADPNDFPALGSHPSTYASQAQPSTAGSNSIQQQQQQLYLQQQQQQQQMGGPPPPPPGISGPNSSTNQQPQANGPAQDDFPALNSGGADSKEARLSNYLRNQTNAEPHGTSSPSIPNGITSATSAQIPPPSSTSTSQSTNATPSTNPPQVLQNLHGNNPESNPAWQQQQHQQPVEPLTRPIQQILSSPVDKWGLKALLYEIQMHMNKTDRGMLVFGEELEELGMDISGEEALYPSFVTPWADTNSLTQPPRIEESYHIPQCYNVHAPPVSTKLSNFTEDTLFLAFYMSPGDVLQLEVAEELYARGWRYHTDLQTWITSPTLPTIDLLSLQQNPTPTHEGSPQWLRGPFIYLDTRTWTRQRTNEEFTIDANLLEITRPASVIVSEEKTQSQTHSPTPSSQSGLVNPSQGPAQGQGQGQQFNGRQ